MKCIKQRLTRKHACTEIYKLNGGVTQDSEAEKLKQTEN